jgi:hypothetical protein
MILLCSLWLTVFIHLMSWHSRRRSDASHCRLKLALNKLSTNG